MPTIYDEIRQVVIPTLVSRFETEIPGVRITFKNQDIPERPGEFLVYIRDMAYRSLKKAMNSPERRIRGGLEVITYSPENTGTLKSNIILSAAEDELRDKIFTATNGHIYFVDFDVDNYVDSPHVMSERIICRYLYDRCEK